MDRKKDRQKELEHRKQKKSWNDTKSRNVQGIFEPRHIRLFTF